MTNYTMVQTEIIKEHRDGDYRCLLLSAPLRWKHENWIVAVERQQGTDWMRVTDYQFEKFVEAEEQWLVMVNRALQGQQAVARVGA